MYTRGNHWAVGECPARSSPGGASPQPARVSASPGVPAARPWGAGFAPTFRPKRPPCPSASREAVGPCRCLLSSPGHPPSTQLSHIPEVTLRGHLPAASFIHLIPTLSGMVLSPNNFGDPGPQGVLEPWSSPAAAPLRLTKLQVWAWGAAPTPPFRSVQRLNPISVWSPPEFPQVFCFVLFALKRFSFLCPFASFPSFHPAGSALGESPGLHADPASLSPESRFPPPLSPSNLAPSPCPSACKSRSPGLEVCWSRPGTAAGWTPGRGARARCLPGPPGATPPLLHHPGALCCAEQRLWQIIQSIRLPRPPPLYPTASYNNPAFPRKPVDP